MGNTESLYATNAPDPYGKHYHASISSDNVNKNKEKHLLHEVVVHPRHPSITYYTTNTYAPNTYSHSFIQIGTSCHNKTISHE